MDNIISYISIKKMKMTNEKNNEIIELNFSDETEILNLLTQSFYDYPLVPSLLKKRWRTRQILKAVINLNGGFKKSTHFGIKKNNEIITCVSLADYSPTAFSVARFASTMLLLLGFKGMIEFYTFFKEMPKYNEPYLKIVLLATKPGQQNKGYGKKMLEFLYELVRKRNCNGLMLSTNFGDPAYKFYLKEGFTVEKEFKVSDMTSCWMRRVI